MLVKTLQTNDSYQLFLKELKILLKRSGVTPSRLPILAEANQKKNWHHSSSRKISWQVGRVILYIEEHLTEELSLESLAEEARLSKYQLIRQFREDKGTTPWKFLISKRIEKAKSLLEEGIAPGQVAVESGFYDQSHLNKTFIEETGLTPKGYQDLVNGYS